MILLMKHTHVSEALMYANFQRKGSTKDNVIKAMSGSRKIEKLKHAKHLLWDNFGTFDILQDHKDRSDSQNHAEMMAVSEDVIDALNNPMDNGVEVKCYAESWHHVPKVKSEEIGDLSMADNLAMLEAKFKVYDSTLNDLKADAN